MPHRPRLRWYVIGGGAVGLLALLFVGLTAAFLARRYPAIAEKLAAFRAEQTRKVLDNPDPRQGAG